MQDDLRSLYRDALPARIASLEQALAAQDSGPAIRSIAHALRGSGGTYGFPDVTTAAGNVEFASDEDLPERTRELIEVLRLVAEMSDDDASTPAMRVLLVDDDPEICLMVTHLLRGAGYVVDEAHDAAAAAAALGHALPDVILMDVMLDAEDGVEAAAALFRSIAGPPPRLVFLTGAVRAEQFERMNAAGAAGIIHKPFDPESFLALFERLIGAGG
jgi:CheY-like chemotaxis protein/HPt (histidine-containing phosphotransfer) domain-containing protein